MIQEKQENVYLMLSVKVMVQQINGVHVMLDFMMIISVLQVDSVKQVLIILTKKIVFCKWINVNYHK
jgi:hypothetical protein